MRTLVFFIACSVAGSIWPAAAAAQTSGYGAQVIRCESNDGRRKLCPADAGEGVRLIRQLSWSVCVRNQTWGANRRGIWVSQGCRAEFRIGRHDSEVDDYRGTDRAHVVRCESPRGALNECRVDVRSGARVLRQLSSAPCVAGRSWGQGRGVIWVSQGCRADFVIGSGPDDGRDNYDSMTNAGSARVIPCESQDGRPQRCAVPGMRSAQMVRQLSRSSCVEGRSWGWDRNGVWVNEGCRAEFSVW